MSQLNSTDRQVAYDCRYFLGDRPCIWHKSEGHVCVCHRYAPVGKRILIIKLDAIGDVLRTTCVLPPLAQAYPEAAITWLTRPEAAPLLANNPHLCDVMTLGPDALAQLSAQRFDQVINLDAGKTSVALATLSKGTQKIGFVLDPRGFVTATNEAAELWLKMGLFDDLKRANRRSYPVIMCDIIGVSPTQAAYVLNLAAQEIDFARVQLRELGVSPDQPVIGIHTGAGNRWALKKWREEGFIELIDGLANDCGSTTQIILFGGQREIERNHRIADRAQRPVVIAETHDDIRHFASLVSLCNVVVCGDTLAMHVAIALKRRVVVLFGPTSAAEIDLFGTGRKILPELECLGCYKTSCDFVPNCMDLITSKMVKDAVLAELSVSLGHGESARP